MASGSRSATSKSTAAAFRRACQRGRVPQGATRKGAGTVTARAGRVSGADGEAPDLAGGAGCSEDPSASFLALISRSAQTDGAPSGQDEAQRLLKEVAASYDKGKTDRLLDEARSRVLSSIVGPFGVAKVLFKDRDGGNVTTQHNAKQGVCAKEAEEYKRPEYTKDFQRAKNEFLAVREEYTADEDSEFYEDAFSKSGQLLDVSAGLKGVLDIDHINALKRLHNEFGYLLTPQERAALGADPANLAITSASTNRAKGSKSVEEMKQKGTMDERDVDMRALSAKERAAARALQKHAPSQERRQQYERQQLAETSFFEGAKMGLQQLIGVFTLELADACWREAQDCFRNGIQAPTDASLLQALKRRLLSVGAAVAAKWKQMLTAFVEGGVSGILSNLVTFVINQVMTTAKKAVRMIREGFWSLFRAFKLVMFPPAGLSPKEAVHDGIKLIIAGLATAGGIAIEVAFETAVGKFVGNFLPPLKPLVGPLSSALVAIAVGLSSCLLVYLWDKLDLFSVEAERRHRFITEHLRQMADKGARLASEEDSKADQSFARIMGALGGA